MTLVVRFFENCRGQSALAINLEEGDKPERTIATIPTYDAPDSLTANSRLVFVQGRRGSACQNSGFFKVLEGQNVGFIPFASVKKYFPKFILE